MTWGGHATALIELDGARLLTDPVLRDRVGPLRRYATKVSSRLSQGIDAVLLSHLHADHSDIPSLRSIGQSAVVFAPSGAGRWLARRGVRNVRELNAGEEAQLDGVRIVATAARHDRRRWPLGVQADPIGFVARGSQSVYFAGDTDLFEGMSALAGTIDLALLPVWGWGPTLGPGHLNPERAVHAAGKIAPRVAVPIHWGTFGIAWRTPRPSEHERPAREFATLMAREQPQVEVRVLAPGERTELDLRERSTPREPTGSP